MPGNSFVDAVDGSYNSLLPMCEFNYSKKILTADEMWSTGKGNCFTLAEAACRQLVTIQSVETAGIALTKFADGTNTHAYCVAFERGTDRAARIDLALNQTLHFAVDAKYEQVRRVMQTDNAMLYAYRYRYMQATKPAKITIKERNLTDIFMWPDSSEQQAVYMPADIGIAALHAIARAGGMHRLLDIATTDSSLQGVVPTIPTR